MKISAGKVDAFINGLDSFVLSVLVYGPDSGLVSQRASVIAKHIVNDISDPFLVVDLNADSLKSDPAKLADEISAISFGGGRRLVRVRDATAGVGAIFKDAFSNVPENAAEGAFVLVTASDLPPSSGLRKLFEAGENIAALPCYQDDIRSIRNVIGAELRKREISFSEDVVTYMAENCRGDRMVVINEVEKLSIYAGSLKEVTLDDAKACIGETTESSFDDICNALASGNQAVLEKHLRRALHQGAMPVSIFRAAQRYFQRIHLVVGYMAEGREMEQAIGKLRPPVFFKQLPDFKSHITRWNRRRSALWRVMDVLYSGEMECKKSGAKPELICSRSLMRAAAMAGGFEARRAG